MFTSILSLIALLAAIQEATPSALPDPLQAGWKGKPVCERLIEDDRQRVLRCTFAGPGAAWHEVLNIGDTTVQYLIVESKENATRG